MRNHRVLFDLSSAKAKPDVFADNTLSCPFCGFAELRKTNTVLNETGTTLWLENKYPTFEKAYQTVFIENDICDSSFADYPKERSADILGIAFGHWFSLIDSGRFKSVALIKNHGRLSGGSVAHPHMQIVGFDDIDCNERTSDADFAGFPIWEQGDVCLNLSDNPRGEYYEFNLSMNVGGDLTLFSTCLQKTIQYVLDELNAKDPCFNLCFYLRNNRIIVKVIPRFVTSVYFLGYSISQIPSDLPRAADVLKRRFFNTLD